jgi:hypothetical protein
LFEAKYFSELQDFREAGGAQSWKRPAASFWVPCAANLSRNGQATITRQLSWLANSAASLWTKTTSGWPATALALGATLITRDSDFGGIDGLAVVALE